MRQLKTEVTDFAAISVPIESTHATTYYDHRQPYISVSEIR